MAKKKRKRAKIDTEQAKLLGEPIELSERQISQHLGSVIKSARDIMRKDKGLSGDLDRLPMLTWILFLKFIDDVEQHREVEAELKGEIHEPIIDPPYRWRDWVNSEKGPRGDDLIAFISQEEATLPDGSKGPGLFTCLRNLRGTEKTGRRDVVAAVFRETYNRMISGYLLRDVLELVDAVDFGSSKQIHVMGRLYETMLKQLRDAAGDSGEFYTPRPVIRFMVNVVDQKLGEKILDPAAGTGGFLVESFEHLSKQCVKSDDMALLQAMTLYGVEAKPLPYLLCQMNMLLHGIDSPDVVLDNSLAYPLREIGDKDRVDVILTNPPFGGEEERAILRNFPKDKQTTETALLFLQLVMRRLKRGKGRRKGGRCAIIIPTGVLFSTGAGQRIKKEMLENFNIHTIVKLPSGVFSPYTDIKTNILFFERTHPTSVIWFYELPLPEGRQNYTKTNPLRYEEFDALLSWWNNRTVSEHAWTVSAEEVVSAEYNLDFRNPNMPSVAANEDPQRIIETISQLQKSITSALKKIEEILGESRTDE